MSRIVADGREREGKEATALSDRHDGGGKTADRSLTSAFTSTSTEKPCDAAGSDGGGGSTPNNITDAAPGGSAGSSQERKDSSESITTKEIQSCNSRTRFDVESRYTIINSVGQGAYGVVCAARDEHKNELVAIKKIERAFEHHTFTKRTLRELKLCVHCTMRTS